MRKLLSNESDNQNIIEASGLVKTFGRVRALDGLDLRVRFGEVHGFLGPNGAGKSTTIRAILGQLRLTGGQLSVFGADPIRDAVAIHRELAYVPGDTSLWPGLTGGECIDLISAFFGGAERRRRDELIERFDLDPTRRTRTYSKGNRQKVALIAALSTKAKLLLLDEPTSGLDPLMAAVFQQVITELREAGRSIVLSSHILDEVEALCDRVTIIRSGKTVRTGTMAELRGQARIFLDVVTELPVTELAGAHQVKRTDLAQGQRLTCTVAASDTQELIKQLAASRVKALTVRPPSLDEIFLAEYQPELAQEPR